MKSIRTLALVTGLLALSGVSQAQFSSTWTAVSDYDFRGFSQSGKSPALQASADYAFGDSGLAIGTWASNVDFDNDEDAELDLYVNYTGKINDTFAFTAGQGNSDTVVDFAGNGAGLGDSLRFFGYGAGATFTNIDATHWQVNYNGGVSHDVITFLNGASVDASDVVFM